MVKAVDMIDNQDLINHWIRRVVAYIIDYIVVYIAVYILAALIFIGSFAKGPTSGFGFFGFFGISWLSAAVWLLYTTLMEGTKGETIGKRLLNLRVEHRSGRMDLKDALVRNLSKINIILVILDGIVGVVTEGDPREKFLDRFANTVVVRTDMDERFPPGFTPATFQKRPVPQPPRPSPRTQAYRR